MSTESEDADEEGKPMPPVRIPRSARQPFQDLVRLDDETFGRLASALTEAELSLSREKFCDGVADSFGADAAKMRRVVRELFRLDDLRMQTDLSADQLADLIADSIKVGETTDFVLSADEVEILRRRLGNLLGERRALGLTAKANALLTEHQYLYLRARLFSDIRPVFAEDASRVEAAVIVHQLAIHYECDGEHRDFHVALDEADIRSLREVLDRAEKKAASLKNLIHKAEVAYLTPEE